MMVLGILNTEVTLLLGDNTSGIIKMLHVFRTITFERLDSICTLISGIPAIVYSCMSRSAAKRGELVEARDKGHIALMLDVASILLGSVFWILLIMRLTM